MKPYAHAQSLNDYWKEIQQIGRELGFQQVSVTNTNLTSYQEKFARWLALGFHGDMDYLHKHGTKRTHPEHLIANTCTIISVRMDYLPAHKKLAALLQDSHKAYIACYALGRDYHKLMRKRLDKFARAIRTLLGDFDYRVFVDSAPVLEKPIAEKAGLGWIGKHTNLINAKAGSWFFLGEIYTDLPLPTETHIPKSHCGSCQACIDICPTRAIIAPYVLDARRCISYLTIEMKGSVPVELRPLIGNRIFGCDDCQLICPWNKFAKLTHEKDFYPRHELVNANLVDLFAWREDEFLKYTEGSAIRRIGYESWLRNIAIALGNAKKNAQIISALQKKINHASAIVREHVRWALEQK